ncbi:MAG: epoxyqueuosine reductase [Dehalococcoidales bacterium]|nr:MAG: epoxyqueuosine reductase [Dehalococcoidales bacterium]
MTSPRNKPDKLLEGVEVDKVGVVKLEDTRDTPIYEKTRSLLPDAKSIIILALEVFPEVVKYLVSERKVGEITLRDLYNRNAELVSGRLDWEAYKVIKALHGAGYKGIPLPASGSPLDNRRIESVLSYKHAAQIAGLGVFGWNSLLLTPEYGARVRLSCIVTDAPFPPSTPIDEYNPCPECGGACIKVCPVSAIKQPEDGETFNIDKYVCSTYYNYAGGCAECLRVCPAGKTKTAQVMGK